MIVDAEGKGKESVGFRGLYWFPMAAVTNCDTVVYSDTYLFAHSAGGQGSEARVTDLQDSLLLEAPMAASVSFPFSGLGGHLCCLV